MVEVADKLKGLDANDAAKAADIIAFAEERRSLWEEHDLAGDIQARIVQAKATLEQEAQQRAALDRFTAVEEELKKPDLPVERMKDLRRQLEEMELRMLESGADLAARYAAARLGADKAYAQRLLDEARAFRDANQGNPRLVLAQYQPAEDEIKVLLDRSYFDKNKELQDYYTPLYQQSIEEADAVAVALSKAGGDVAWIDCLAPPQASNWNASAVSGFSHQVQNGALKLIGPDADAGKLAVISIGDREQWRHFELDIEFVIEKGDFELYLRLGRSPNSNTLSVPLRTATEPKNLVTGKKYAARISVIGSRWSVRYEGEDIDTPSPQEGDIHWASGRKGGIGFVVMPESRATFTRFRVRELR